jgi:hypothetical protein
MTLSCILLAAPKRLHRWRQVGASMIAIDTLVHNFLVRTGILARFDANHSYGAACYQAGGCADIIAAVAARIDTRQFNPGFPQLFPRFVQHAIWRFCAQSGLTCATAIGLMIASLAITLIAKFVVVVTV